jgi:c-di-GMP-binding flagellar brake protein YcgR
MEERRKFVRLDTRLPVSYQITRAPASQMSLSSDIGGGGVCLFLSEPLKTGTVLRIEVTLPDQPKPIAFTGEVVWCEQYEMIGKTQRDRSVEAGVKFVQIQPHEQQAIMRHVILSLQPRPPA